MAIFVSQFFIHSDYAYSNLYFIVAIETTLNLGLFYLYRTSRTVNVQGYFIQVLLDILFLTALLYYSGGASNPFVSLLLIPIAIAAVTLPKRLLMAATLLAMSCYSGLLITLNPHDLHHMNMEQHVFGMWLNFILSACVVVLVVAALLRAVNKQEELVNKQREEQLRQEQLLSLGTAAAQFAHRLATPLGTVNLISEELQELQTYDVNLFNQLDQQLNVCKRHLDDFRVMAEQVKSNSKHILDAKVLVENLRQEVQLNFPSCKVSWLVGDLTDAYLKIDSILMPALLNLVQNATLANQNQATAGNKQIEISVTANLRQQQIVFAIRDHGKGFNDETLLQLGTELVDSKYGLGMGVFLSHATLNNLDGKLKLYNHPHQGAVAEVTLPLVTKNLSVEKPEHDGR